MTNPPLPASGVPLGAGLAGEEDLNCRFAIFDLRLGTIDNRQCGTHLNFWRALEVLRHDFAGHDFAKETVHPPTGPRHCAACGGGRIMGAESWMCSVMILPAMILPKKRCIRQPVHATGPPAAAADRAEIIFCTLKSLNPKFLRIWLPEFETRRESPVDFSMNLGCTEIEMRPAMRRAAIGD